MTLTRKDAVAAVLTALAVLAFVATHESWNVWLIGSSHRWAAGAIMVLGALTCGLGSAARAWAGTRRRSCSQESESHRSCSRSGPSGPRR